MPQKSKEKIPLYSCVFKLRQGDEIYSREFLGQLCSKPHVNMNWDIDVPPTLCNNRTVSEPGLCHNPP